MQKQFINPETLAPPNGYTQVVAARGKMIFVAGQVGFDAKGQLVGRYDVAAQAAQAFENLKLALAAAGASLAEVVKINIYVVDLNNLKAATVREARAKYFPTNPPVSTLVGVEALVDEDLIVEVDAVAILEEEE